MKLSEEIQKKLRCPATKAKLKRNGNYLENETDINIRYPIIDGIPVLINNENSLFSVDDFVKKRNTTFDLHRSKFNRFISKLLPKISANIKAKLNYDEIATILSNDFKILVIGGSIKGQGSEAIYSNETYEVISSDVSFGPYTKIIFDCHDIPFEEETFDCVIVQAVLEHVLDLHCCVDEIHRVLKAFGVVYAETAFVQPVHMKQYDFTRYTHLGHRRLFRNFEEIKSGPCCGPGSALALSYSFFLRSFATSTLIRQILFLFACLTSFLLIRLCF